MGEQNSSVSEKWFNERNLFYASILCFILSLFPNAFCTTFRCQTGGEAIFNGAIQIIGILYDILKFVTLKFEALNTWYANLLFIITLFLAKKKPKVATILSLISLVIMLSFLFFSDIIDNSFGRPSKIIGIGIGYWFWVLSSVLLLTSNILNLKKQKVIILAK